MKEHRLSTGRIVDADLVYAPNADGSISAIYGYDQMVSDLNDEIDFVEGNPYSGGSRELVPFTHQEHIEIAQWQIGRWQDCVERLILKGEV